MKFGFHNAPTLTDRVALGRSSKWPPGGAVIPFGADWEERLFFETLSRETKGALSRKLNDGQLVKGPYYLYRDEQGSVVSAVLRLDGADGKKEVLPLRASTVYANNPDMIMKAIEPPRPLYNLHLLAAAPLLPVLLVEGEKAADAAGRLFPQLVATTFSGGAPGVPAADFRALTGRDVIVWPDHDEIGLDAAEKATLLLQDVGAASVRVVQVPDWFPPKWDVADTTPEPGRG